VTGPTNCGKNEFVAKFIQRVKQMMTPTPHRIVWCYGERQRRTVPTCHWLQNGVSIIKYATGPKISALEIHHRRKNILSDICIFIHFRIFAFLYFRASATPRHVIF